METDPNQESFEVVFCELCNASVPLQDVESGAAVQHQGKVIGACCLPALRAGTAPARTKPVPAGGEGRLLAVGLVLLAAVAGGAFFLDQRLSSEAARDRGTLDRLVAAVESQTEVLQSLDTAMDGTATRAELGLMQARLAGLDEAWHEAHGEVRKQFTDQAGALAALQGRIGEVAKGIVDPQPALQRLEAMLERQGASLAELRAMPRERASEPAKEPAPAAAPPAAGGLPPELARQVGRLADADPAVRFEALDELLRSGNAAVRQHVLPLAKDGDLFVRRLAVEGLRQFRHAEAVEALLAALADPEEIVRDTAWRSLQELTGEKFPFDAAASRDARRRAQQRWQEWWDAHKEGFGGPG